MLVGGYDYISEDDKGNKRAVIHDTKGYAHTTDDLYSIKLVEMLNPFHNPEGDSELYTDILQRFRKIYGSYHEDYAETWGNVVHRLYTYILYKGFTTIERNAKTKEDLVLMNTILSKLQDITSSRESFIKERTPSGLPKAITLDRDGLNDWLASNRYRGIFIDITGLAADSETDNVLVTYVARPLDIENLYNEKDF